MTWVIYNLFPQSSQKVASLSLRWLHEEHFTVPRLVEVDFVVSLVWVSVDALFIRTISPIFDISFHRN